MSEREPNPVVLEALAHLAERLQRALEEGLDEIATDDLAARIRCAADLEQRRN